MSTPSLPERASLEYLKKLAKDRLRELRRADPNARLAAAQLAVAREFGFRSWRALKAELERRQPGSAPAFFDACERGDLEMLQSLLAAEPALARAADARRPHAGWTGLHSAAGGGHGDAVRLLLQHGADPNAREAGDHTYPLHWAAAHGHVDALRALLDAGGDVHGAGDVHELDVIGWATVFRSHGDISPEMVSLLIERGARHHIFSALAVGDAAVIRKVVEEDSGALTRRMSRFEQGQTALHFAMSRKRYDLLDSLIALGADLEAADQAGRTALAVAMLQGDHQAMTRLHGAGAREPETTPPQDLQEKAAGLAARVRKGVPGINVPDIAATLDWYTSIGFKELGRYADSGVVNWGMLSFGKAELMLGMGKPEAGRVSLWFYMEEVDTLYQVLKSRQLQAARAVLAGDTPAPQWVGFVEDIYDPFYGGRQFSIRDPNGYTLVFYAP